MLDWLTAPAPIPNWIAVALVLLLLIDHALIGVGFRMQAAWRDLYMRTSAMLDDEQPSVDTREGE